MKTVKRKRERERDRGREERGSCGTVNDEDDKKVQLDKIESLIEVLLKI